MRWWLRRRLLIATAAWIALLALPPEAAPTMGAAPHSVPEALPPPSFATAENRTDAAPTVMVAPPSAHPKTVGLICADRPEMADAANGSLTTIRSGEHPGHDRLVFEFVDALPGYRVELQGDGLLVELKGVAVGPLTEYPIRLSLVTDVVLLKRDQFSEQWRVQIRPPMACPRVATLAAPPRLVLDVQSRT